MKPLAIILAIHLAAPALLADRIVPQAIEAYGAIFAAAPGETLRFADDYTWDNNATGMTIPAKPRVNDGSGNPLYVTLRSNLSLASGVRVQLTDSTHMPVFNIQSVSPAMTFGAGTQYYNLDGLRFSSVSTSNNTNYGFISIGLPTLTHTMTAADLPHDFNLSHLIVRGREDGGNNTSYYQHTGIQADGLNVTIRDSNVTNFNFQPTTEANAVLIRVGKNVTLDNNELSANGECVMLHGVDAYSDTEAGLVGVGQGIYADGTIVKNNYFYKPYSIWYNIGVTKNLFENKTGHNTHVFNNLFEYSMSGPNDVGQHGIAIVANSRNAAMTSTVGHQWMVTHDIEIDHNIVHHAGGVFQVTNIFDDVWDSTKLTNSLAAGLTARNNNFNIHDNYADDISGPVYNNLDLYIGLGMRGNGPDNFTFQRNTILFRESGPGTYASGTIQGIPYSGYTATDSNSGVTNGAGYIVPPVYGLTFVNQVYDSNVWNWQLKCDGASHGLGCFTQLDSTSQANIRFTNNLQMNANPSEWTGLTTLNSTYPGKWANNTFNTTHATGQGADAATLLANECTLRTGNRSSIPCTNPTVPTY